MHGEVQVLLGLESQTSILIPQSPEVMFILSWSSLNIMGLGHWGLGFLGPSAG